MNRFARFLDIPSDSFVVKIMRNVVYRIECFVKQNTKLYDKEGCQWLDVGAQNQRYKKYLLKSHYYSLDITQNEAGTIDYVVDINQGAPMIQNGVMDFILCTQVLEHLKDPPFALREFFRFLKPGGRVFLTTHHCFEEHMQPHDYFRFTRYGLKYLAESAGFTVERITPHGGIFQVLGLFISTLPIKLFLRRNSLPYYIYLILFSIPLFVLNLFCYILDFLDKDPEITLNYECIFLKPTRKSDL